MTDTNKKDSLSEDVKLEDHELVDRSLYVTEDTFLDEDSSTKESTDKKEEDKAATENSPAEKVYTAEEQEAMKGGWNPNHSGEDFVPAREFLRVGKIMKSYEKKIDDLKFTVRELADHTRKVEEVAYQKAREQLRREKEEAIDNGDRESYNVIVQREEALEKEAQLLKAKEAVSSPEAEFSTPEMMDFKERNKAWFNNASLENVEMVEDADIAYTRIANRYEKRGLALDQATHLRLVEDAVRKLWPDKFKNAEQDKPVKVLESSSGSTSKTSYSSRMTPTQRKIAQFAKEDNPNFSIEDYAKQLDQLGELKK